MKNKFIIALLLSVFLITCIPRQGRINKLIDKGTISQTKIITIYDTTYVDSIKIEEVYVYETFEKMITDTLYIEKDKLRLQIVKDTDTVRIIAECQGDTIYTIKEVPVQQVVYTKNNSLRNWFILIICILLLGVIFKFIQYIRP